MAMTREELMAAVPPVVAETPARRTKVAVLGFTDSWKLAPFNDPEFEVWGLNELYQFIPRWDRWFDIHQRSIYENDRNRVSDHIAKLRAMTCPIYMQQHWEDIPNSVPYPLEEIARAFANPCADAKPYLTNSITFMILLAILEGFQEIQIYGVDMAHDCLAPDMRVLTADMRWVPAGQLKVGQEILAFDEEAELAGAVGGAPLHLRHYRKTKVQSLSTIKRPCHRLYLNGGYELTSSVGHQWLTFYTESQSWQRTDQLKEGVSLAAVRNVNANHRFEGVATTLLRTEFIGEQDVIGLQTGTRTLIVEGFASHNSEYSFQKPSCEYAVGIAQGRGIKTYIPHESDLVKTNFIYGYEADAAHAFDRKLKARHDDILRKIGELDQQIANLSEVRGQYRGAAQDTEHIMKNWKSN